MFLYILIGLICFAFGGITIYLVLKHNINIEKIRMFFVSVLEFTIFTFEKIFILSCLCYIIWWGWKVFMLNKDVENAKSFISFCNDNWIGLLIFVPFMFYRIIIQKLQELRQIANTKFRPVDAEEVIIEKDASTLEVE